MTTFTRLLTGLLLLAGALLYPLPGATMPGVLVREGMRGLFGRGK